jgi:septum site-determining protein MinC
MGIDRLQIKGNRKGLNLLINLMEFSSMAELADAIKQKMEPLRKFYDGNAMFITTYPIRLKDQEMDYLRQALMEELNIPSIHFEESNRREELPKVFKGIGEGQTKFITKSLRGGALVDYPGNVVVVGDVHIGAEIHAEGNIIIMGQLKGRVFAGSSGNEDAIIAAIGMTPALLSIAGIFARPPESNKTSYPEVAKLKDGAIYVEPYNPGKFII